MKILVFAHQLVVGGTPLNGIELAAGLRDVGGHDVVVFATPGPMVPYVHCKGLRFIAAPQANIYPSPARMNALRAAVSVEKPDLIHVWDWFQCLDAYYAVHLPMRVPMVVTDMCMSVTRILPKSLPTTFGTPELVDLARASGRKDVHLLLPPVDIDFNSPFAVDPNAFKGRYGISSNDINLVTVSRLDPWMKGDSLRRTIDAVKVLGTSLPLRLIVVGDGPARAELESLSKNVNAVLRREAVTLAGEWVDPRPAYAAADIVVGMGGSALRGMAFAKPVLVVGAAGFCAPFNQETAASFLRQGFYGQGSGAQNNSHWVEQVRRLATRSSEMSDVGQFSRRFVVEHFALEKMSARLSEVCVKAAQTSTPSLTAGLVDGLRTAGVYLRERLFLHRPFNALHRYGDEPVSQSQGAAHG